MHNRRVVFVVPCMLAPGLQVLHDYANVHWGRQFVEFFMENSVDIIPLTCVESSFEGYDLGIKRNRHGIDYYSKEKGFCEYCKLEAERDAQKVCELKKAGYWVLGILGVEHSPSCAINYLYSCRGTIKTSGLYMSSLKGALAKEKMDIEFIGINRKYPRKAFEKVVELLEDCC